MFLSVLFVFGSIPLKIRSFCHTIKIRYIKICVNTIIWLFIHIPGSEMSRDLIIFVKPNL